MSNDKSSYDCTDKSECIFNCVGRKACINLQFECKEEGAICNLKCGDYQSCYGVYFTCSLNGPCNVFGDGQRVFNYAHIEAYKAKSLMITANGDYGLANSRVTCPLFKPTYDTALCQIQLYDSSQIVADARIWIRDEYDLRFGCKPNGIASSGDFKVLKMNPNDENMASPFCDKMSFIGGTIMCKEDNGKNNHGQLAYQQCDTFTPISAQTSAPTNGKEKGGYSNLSEWARVLIGLAIGFGGILLSYVCHKLCTHFVHDNEANVNDVQMTPVMDEELAGLDHESQRQIMQRMSENY